MVSYPAHLEALVLDAVAHVAPDDARCVPLDGAGPRLDGFAAHEEDLQHLEAGVARTQRLDPRDGVLVLHLLQLLDQRHLGVRLEEKKFAECKRGSGLAEPRVWVPTLQQTHPSFDDAASKHNSP